MGTRDQFHQKLRAITSNVYFQPPEKFKMKYPCIRYSRGSRDSEHADDLPYRISNKYSVTAIYYDPDNTIADEIAKLPTANQTAAYKSKNLYHDVFDVYF